MSTLKVNQIQTASGASVLTTDGSANVTVSNYLTSANPFFIGYFSTIASPTSNFTPFLNSYYNRGFTITGSTARITVPVTGRYMFHVRQLVNSTGGLYQQHLKNGTELLNYGYSNDDSSYDLDSASAINLNANEYMTFYYDGTVNYGWSGLGHSVVIAALIS